uniref:Proline rich 16 n=1 Tax=Loxodonta africana TaxID=9785 RepID=G3UBP6_LOXAF
QVVDQIDTLTSDLQLEDEMTDSSKTDTLNSSSSGTTASSIEKIKLQANAPLIKPPTHPSAILTVLRKPNPPPPPPRLTPVKCEDPQMQPLMHRPEKDRCPQAGPRERVRFNEKVQYHGYCPDCDTRYNIKNREVHLHSEPVHPPVENGGLGISHTKPQKTILRKSTTTTV